MCCGDHFAAYANIRSCCTAEINIIVYIKIYKYSVKYRTTTRSQHQAGTEATVGRNGHRRLPGRGPTRTSSDLKDSSRGSQDAKNGFQAEGAA